ncbi:MAG TPA: HAD hydrolase-like protein [Terriglobales bacterium]|nr:HAD hydrolase-like protein [Terriglobales bacterium]
MVPPLPSTPGGNVLPEVDAYLFDIDGTLLNVSDATHYFAFLNAMRSVFGVECNLDGVPVHGNTDVGILRASLAQSGVSDELFVSRIGQAMEQMCAEVVRNAADLRAVPCSSVRVLLEHLHGAGRLMGIVTGNLEAIGWAKLRAAGLQDFFHFGCFSGPLANVAETSSPAMLERRVDILKLGVEEVKRRLGADATVCAVGDTPRDIEAARDLGIPIVAVATGIYSVDQLQKLGPDLCVRSCEEIEGFPFHGR